MTDLPPEEGLEPSAPVGRVYRPVDQPDGTSLHRPEYTPDPPYLHPATLRSPVRGRPRNHRPTQDFSGSSTGYGVCANRVARLDSYPNELVFRLNRELPVAGRFLSFAF